MPEGAATVTVSAKKILNSQSLPPREWVGLTEVSQVGWSDEKRVPRTAVDVPWNSYLTTTKLL